MDTNLLQVEVVFLNGTPYPFSARRVAHFETSSLTWDVWVSQGPPRPFMKSVL